MASDFDLNVAWCPDYFGLDDEEHDFPAHNVQGDFDLNLEPHEGESSFIQETEVLEHQANDNTLVAVNHHKRSRLSGEDKLQILCWLLNKAKACKLKRGSITEASHLFNLSVRCISSIWNTARKQSSSMQRYNVSTKFHFSGRKRIQVQLDEITKLKMGERSCIRDLATMLNMSKSTVHRMIKRGLIKPHTNSLHPGLKEPNKIERLKWVFSLLMGNTPATMREYYPMYDIVHLDEKWFYLTTKSQRVYLANNERGRYRAASSSKFIPKVMFTACVARPRYNSAGECTFDGKIGIFPFTYQEPAKRTSKNREKGTMITKVVESVNQKVTRDMLINEIIPAIKEKWPRDGGPTTIFIQQDNAKAHITHEDPEWQLIHEQDGFNFILIQQPPNSPDLNILDLGFFRSIQSLMHKKMPADIDKLLEAVNQAFYELDPKTLSNVWLSLQYVMNEILKVGGGNDYDLPHVNKKKLEKQGVLSDQVKAPMWAVMDAWDKVHGQASTSQQP